MPNFDQTGPQGKGAMTGRGLGSCKKAGKNIGFMGRCRGNGRGFGRSFGLTIPQTKDEQIKRLESCKQALCEELEDIEKELNSLK